VDVRLSRKMLHACMPIAGDKEERKGAAWSATRRSSPSLMIRMTSRRRMIIFCPKNESSPFVSLNRGWFTDPTSLRRSQAFGFPFGLVCSFWYLLKFFRQHLRSLVYFVGEG